MSILTKLTRQLTSRPALSKPLATNKRCLTGSSKNNLHRQSIHTYNKRFYSTTDPKKSFIAPSQQAFTWKSAIVLGITAVGLVFYFKNEKEQLAKVREKRERDKIRRLGKPNIGSPFKLYNVNADKLTTSEELMHGQFTMLYFGFTHCPDICPEELDKMAEVVDAVKEEFGSGILTPVFITCDPLRDTKEVVKEYVQDFHPDLIGFTGSPEELKRVARSYRVYSYTPPDVNVDDDYLVDHSIFIYLMDPEGKFVDCYARNVSADEILVSFKNYMHDYIQDGGVLKNHKKK